MAIGFHTDDCEYILRNRIKIRTWLRNCAATEGFRIGELNYIFCSARRLLEMNRQFLGHDYYTDVITFDYSDPEQKRASGDVFIDIETVADNAARFGATPEREMQRVIVHGLLHLCGYPDKTPETERIMHEREDFHLAQLDKLL